MNRQELNPTSLGRAYRMPDVIDYGPHRGNGLLVTTGSGLLMAMMDQVPTCRWAVDFGGGRAWEHRRAWSDCCARLVSHLVVVTWFALSDPSRFEREVALAFPYRQVVAYSHPTLRWGIQARNIDNVRTISRSMEHLWSASRAPKTASTSSSAPT